MGNSGKNSNTSQFFVTLDKAPQCDGKHVIFGEVVSGMEVIRAVEQFATSSGGEPSVPIKITDCGAYVPLVTPAGSWFDRPDSQSFTGSTPEFMVRPRVGILAPTKQIAGRFQKSLSEHASPLLVAVDEIEGGDEEIVRSVLEPLEKFALDVIVAAPPCVKYLKRMNVPDSWKDKADGLRLHGLSVPKKEDVFLEAKPVEVMSVIMNKSWVGTMRPGWLLSASFGNV